MIEFTLSSIPITDRNDAEGAQMSMDVNVPAELSAAAYRHVSELNLIVTPAGWTRIAISPDADYSDDPRTGFSAAAYLHRETGEVVIADTGTNSDLPFGVDWWRANIPAALGLFSPQVRQAAEFYWQVLNLPQVRLTNKHRISFTGHSFGGGAGAAPQVLLTATHEKALDVVTLDQLKQHAADLRSCLRSGDANHSHPSLSRPIGRDQFSVVDPGIIDAVTPVALAYPLLHR